MTAKRAPGSRSLSQPTQSITTTTTSDVASSSAKKSNGGKTQPSSAAGSSGKSAQVSSVTSSSVKSTQSRAAASSLGKRNGERTQPKREDILEHQQREQGDFEVPMDFPRDQIKLGKEFGEGDFGKVFQAEAKKLLPGQKKTMVVVKQLKEGATKEERDVFLRPVEAMK